MGETVKTKSTLLVLLLVALVLSPVLTSRFVLFDDDLHIFRNSNLALPFYEGLKAIWFESYRGLYIPITYTVWLVLTHITRILTHIQTLEQLSALPFHLLNLGFHLINSFLVGRLLSQFIRNRPAVLCGMTVFALHPIQVEAVAWATGYKDLFSTFFCLCAFMMALRFKETDKVLYGGGSTCLYLMALLCKPAACVLPLVMLGSVFFLDRNRWRRILILAIVWAVFTVPVAYITSILQPPELLQENTPFFLRPLIALDAISFYLRKLFLPSGLIIDYSRTPHFVLEHWEGYASIFFLSAIVGVSAYKKQHTILVFFGLFALSLFPVLGFLPFAFQNFSTVADHYMYFPMIIVSVFSALCVSKFNWKTKWALPLGGILALLSFIQATQWVETEKLFHYTLSVNPNSVIAHNNLAVAYETRGDLISSLQHYQKASEINPRLNHHRYNVGNTLLKLGRIAEAQQAFEGTLTVDPDYAEAYFSLGIIAESSNEFVKAKGFFEKALELDPILGKAGIKVGTTLVRLGKVNEGILKIKDSLMIDPRATAQGYFHLGKAYLVKKDYQNARDAFQHCLFLRPDHADAHEQLSKLK